MLTQTELKAAIEVIKASLLAKVTGDIDLTYEITLLNDLAEPGEPVKSFTKEPQDKA